MNRKDKRDLEIARLAIRGSITWAEAARKMDKSHLGVYQRICSLLRKDFIEKAHEGE